MKNIPSSTYKILLNKALNRAVDDSWAFWAIEMIEAGFESDSLYVLAGILEPYNQFELEVLTSNVFDDLDLNYKNKNEVVQNYIRFLITNSINKPETFISVLKELSDFYFELDLDSNLSDFDRLYLAKKDLLLDEFQWNWKEANRSNIYLIINNYFIAWKTKFESRR